MLWLPWEGAVPLSCGGTGWLAGKEHEQALQGGHRSGPLVTGSSLGGGAGGLVQVASGLSLQTRNPASKPQPSAAEVPDSAQGLSCPHPQAGLRAQVSGTSSPLRGHSLHPQPSPRPPFPPLCCCSRASFPQASVTTCRGAGPPGPSWALVGLHSPS